MSAASSDLQSCPWAAPPAGPSPPSGLSLLHSAPAFQPPPLTCGHSSAGWLCITIVETRWVGRKHIMGNLSSVGGCPLTCQNNYVLTNILTLNQLISLQRRCSHYPGLHVLSLKSNISIQCANYFSQLIPYSFFSQTVYLHTYIICVRQKTAGLVSKLEHCQLHTDVCSPINADVS